MSPRKKNFGLLLFLILVFLIGSFYAALHPKKTTLNLTPSALADCFTINRLTGDPSAMNTACLQHTVSALLQSYLPQQILEYLVSSRTPNVIRANCHPIAHIIGEDLYAQTHSIETSLSSCSFECRFGCQHGAIGAAVVAQIGANADDLAHADLSSLEKLAAKYCSDGKLCHAIGHLFFERFGSYEPALAECRKVSVGTVREYCFQGVFMEGAGTEGVLFLSGQTQSLPPDYRYPCSTVLSRDALHACFEYLGVYQVQLFEKNNIATTSRMHLAIATCESFNGTARTDCFEGLAFNEHYLSETYSNSSDAKFCNSLPQEQDQLGCILGTISYLTESQSYGKSVHYCSSFTDSREKNFCYQAGFQFMEKMLMENEIDSLCRSLNNNECSTQWVSYLKSKQNLPDYELGL